MIGWFPYACVSQWVRNEFIAKVFLQTSHVRVPPLCESVITVILKNTKMRIPQNGITTHQQQDSRFTRLRVEECKTWLKIAEQFPSDFSKTWEQTSQFIIAFLSGSRYQRKCYFRVLVCSSGRQILGILTLQSYREKMKSSKVDHFRDSSLFKISRNSCALLLTYTGTKERTELNFKVQHFLRRGTN